LVKEQHFVRVPDPRGSRKILLGKVIDFKTLKEDWNEYELSDGTIVKVKLVAQSISYVIDPEKNDIMRNDLGEPVINIRYTVIISPIFTDKKLGLSEKKKSR